MPTRTLTSPPQRKPPVASPPPRRAAATPAPHRAQQLQRSLGNAGTLALLQGKGGHAPAVTADSARPAAQARASGAAPGAAGGMQAGLSATLASIRSSAEAQKAHQPGEMLVASAQSAAKEPALEQQRSANQQTVARLAATPPGQVERSPFRAQLRAAVEKAMPQPASATDAAKLLDEAAPAVSQVLRNALPTHRESAAGPLQGAARAEAPPVSKGPSTPAALRRDTPAPNPPQPRAEAAIPPRLPDTAPDCGAHRQPADQALAREGLGDAQLARGREPAFAPVQQARAKASTHDQGARRQYRHIEANIRAGALSAARADLGQGLAGMHAVKTARHGTVAAHQAATRARDATERQRVTQRMGEIKTHTLKDVEQILGALENEAGMRFEIGLKQAEDAYGAAFAEARGGLGTWLGTWGEAWREHIHKALVLARAAYLRHVDAAIDAVATYVEAELQRARQRVLDGRRELEHYVTGLDGRLRAVGAEALTAVTAEFANMASQIDTRRDDLVERLTLQYTASRERLAEAEQALKDENRSLWDKAYAASLGVVEQVAAFRAMLLGMLGEAGSMIGLILADPLGFLGKLVTAIRLGLGNFVARIREHLQKGLMDWLCGVMAEAGIQMPERFDLQGVTSIVLQVVGLTYAHIRSRAVAIVGEATVARLEKTAAFFQILLREGMPGLARLIREKLTELKTTVVDAVFDFIREKVIGAGITWILSLLNPASAFFKACKAIYDILSFFVERASSLAALARSIVASVGAIARGALGPAATWIENALARSIPIAIGFLAGLLGLGDVAGSIRKLIDKARGPVNRAVDWGIGQIVKITKAISDSAHGKDRKHKEAAEYTSPWAIGTAGVLKEIQTMKKNSRNKLTRQIKARIPEWKEKYAFSSLRLETKGERWSLFGSMSPERELTSDMETPTKPSTQHSDLHEELTYEFYDDKERRWKPGKFIELKAINGVNTIIYRPKYAKKTQASTPIFKQGGKVLAYKPLKDKPQRPSFEKRVGADGRAEWVRGISLSAQNYEAIPKSVSPTGWKWLNGKANWDRCHLIYGDLGGPPVTWNLVPAPRSINYKMRNHEKMLTNLVKKEGRHVLFEAEVTYRKKSEGPHYISDFAKGITVTISITDEGGEIKDEKFALTYLIEQPKNDELVGP